MTRGARCVAVILAVAVLGSSPAATTETAQAGQIGAGIAVFVLNRALDKSGLLDKIGLGKEKAATPEQVADLKRSIEGVSYTLQEIKEQIADSTSAISDLIQELQQFTAFTAVNTTINEQAGVFDSVQRHYADFLVSAETEPVKGSLMYQDINTVILSNTSGTDFGGRVDRIHNAIVPIMSAGGMNEGLLTVVAKLARTNGKPFSVVENYYLRLLSWETFAMGMYLDAMRYRAGTATDPKRAAAITLDVENSKKAFVNKLALQRVAFLQAAEAYALHGGPLSWTDAAVATAPMRRADLVVNAMEGASGWFTLAGLGFNDGILTATEGNSAAPMVRVDAASKWWPLDGTVGIKPSVYYQRSARYSLAGPGGATNACYYYLGPDPQRYGGDTWKGLIAGSTCDVRVWRYRSGRNFPPFTPRFIDIVQGRRLDATTGTFYSDNIDLVSGKSVTGQGTDAVTLTAHPDGYGAPASEIGVVPAMDATGKNVTDPNRVVLLIPGNALVDQYVYLTPKCGASPLVFGFSESVYTASAPPRPELIFRRVSEPVAACEGASCPAPGVAFAFTCPNGQEQFMTPYRDGNISGGPTPYYFRATKDSGTTRLRLSYPEPGDPDTRQHVYLNIPASVGFYGGMVGHDIVTKKRDLADMGGKPRLSVHTASPEQYTRSPISAQNQNDVRINVRVTGQAPLNLTVTAKSRLNAELIRIGYECGTPYPQVEGHLSVDTKEFATLTESIGGCDTTFFKTGSLSYRRPVNSPFEGKLDLTKKPGESFDIIGLVRTTLKMRGGEQMRTSAWAFLEFDTLELAITNLPKTAPAPAPPPAPFFLPPR